MLSGLVFLATRGAAVFVAPTGADGNFGTAGRPVRTLARALEIAREKQARRIQMAPGDYPVSGSLELGVQDRGLTIEGGGKARLLGGRRIRVWRGDIDPAIRARLSPEARGKVVWTDLAVYGLDGGELRRRGFADSKPASALELFYGGRPMQIARWPNAGDWARVEAPKGEKGFTYAGDRPKRWQAPNDPWAFGYFRFDWCDTYDQVTLDPDSQTAELSRAPEFGIEAKRRFYFFNVLEELDSPGEYFVDRAAKRLYFWPPEGKGQEGAVASLIEGPIFRLKEANGVRLRGLQLEAGRDGAILIEGGAGNRVESCLIRNFGTYGVSIRNGKDSGVVGCDLTGLGTRGIELFGGDRKTLTSGGLYAEDNHIWGYSRWPRTYQAGIAIEGVGARVAHNLIEEAPHNAILLSGNDHTIEFNDIRRVCLETGDSGAVYMGRNLTMRGNRIQYNRFRDIVPTVNTEGGFTNVMSVYLDDQWCGTTITGNLFEGKGTGILVGGGRDNVVENNVFVGKDVAFHIDQRGKGWAKDKEPEFQAQIAELAVDKPPYATRYPALARLRGEDMMLATGNLFVNNVIVGKRPYWFQDGLTEASVGAKGNVLMAEGTLAAALKRTPKPIPIGKIGLKRKAPPRR